MPQQSYSICYLCGKPIDTHAKDEQMGPTRDHVPPKLLFPKQIRQEENLNLQFAPAHKKCNNDHKDDEDYFYNSLYPLVANSNPAMAQAIFRDFLRRCQKPQSRAMLRGIFAKASEISKGGIILPAPKIEVNVDLYRVQRTAGKIARGVLFLATERYIPETSIVDMRICEEESEVPKMYQLSWKITSPQGSYPKVFTYKYVPFNGYHILSLLFWQAFMFCITIQDTQMSC